MSTDAHGRSGSFHPVLSPAVCLILIGLVLSACITGDDDDDREAAATLPTSIASTATETPIPTSTATATASATSRATPTQSLTPQPVDESELFVQSAAIHELDLLTGQFEEDEECLPVGSEIDVETIWIMVDRAGAPPWTATVDARLLLTRPDGQIAEAIVSLSYEDVRPNNMSVTLINSPECPWE